MFWIIKYFFFLFGIDFDWVGNLGWVVNISFVGGKIVLLFFGVYVVLKYVLEGLSEVWCCELVVYGIDMIIVVLGVVVMFIWDKV